jgi:putative flavoprotein involved in K+ transport
VIPSLKGDQHHSSQHPGPDKYQNKKAVLIGSNNSAHDICAALWEAGADVAMVQRSTTHVVKSDSPMEQGLASLYSDLIFASLPYKILHEFQIPVYNAIRERDADYYKRLEKAGFLLDYGDDDSGLFMKYLRRGSGYYIDVGASELVANGSIKLKSGVDVKKLTEHSVILTDGTELPADLVV